MEEAGHRTILPIYICCDFSRGVFVKHSIDIAAFTADVVIGRGREVIRIEAEALDMLSSSLDENFVLACQTILNAKRRVVVTGMGKSGHIGRKVAATFAATGTPAFFVHPAEAGHGDLGMLTRGDVLLVLSNSGNTAELRSILNYARGLGIQIIGIASRRTSAVMEHADIRLCTPSTREACAANVAPTTSTALQLALGDALALAVMDMRGVTSENLRSFHPAGSIGLRLTPISEIMHNVDHLPIVMGSTPIADAIAFMSSCNFGIAGVVDNEGGLVGVITDGDLRRHFGSLNGATASDIMTHHPKTLPADMMAEDALLFLNDSKITAAFVLDRLDLDNPSRPIGLVHIHDFLRFGLN
jgi:arabinose-5-phosphate isomerase